MPGIVGLISKRPRDWAEAQLAKMLNAQTHDRFHKVGMWTDAPAGAFVGWTALEGSFSASMPITNERGDICLIFSGQEYPDDGTVARLKQKGHAVELGGPSYLVHRYEEDQNFFTELNGIFHGVIVDRDRGRTILFNDRYGMHRVYYSQTADTFYFAAEAKAILSVCPDLRVGDSRSLGEYVALNCVLGDRTIFKYIYSLPSASAWVFENRSLTSKRTYFCAREWENQPTSHSDVFYRDIRDVLSEKLPRYFTGAGQKGIALTGGFDTRLLMAFGQCNESVQTYTFGGTLRNSEDVTIARQVARECGRSHQIIPVDNEFLSRFSHYAERSMFLSEGGTDVYHASDVYLSEKAREIAPIKVVGTYGSEILRQVRMFKPAPIIPDLFENTFASFIRQATDTYDEFAREHPLTFAAFRQFPWYHHGILALEKSHLEVRSPFLDKDFVRIAYRTPRPIATQPDIRPTLIADACPRLGRIRSDRGMRARQTLASAINRVILEFSFRAEYAFDYGMPQWLASSERALSWLRLQRLFLGRHKFLHFRIWYREALSAYVREILLDPLTLSRPFLNRRAVEYIVKSHIEGSRNFTREIHKLLSLELLHRLFFDPKSA